MFWTAGGALQRRSLAAEIGPGFTLIGSGGYDHHTPAGVTQKFAWVVLRAEGTSPN